jgi:hypothetical protein
MTASTREAPRQAIVARYLKAFAAVVAVVGVVVVSINLASFRMMTRPQNAAIVQLAEGWGRLYKPILYDAADAEVAIFGASFTRDAFDPETVERIVGMSAFNFAVSGGAPYENRRFAQSAAGNPNLKAVVFNLDSFVPSPGNPKVSYGFDESILNRRADGEPNRFVGLRRAAALALSGAAVGANVQMFWTLRRIAGGAAREDVLTSYERRDNTGLADEIAAARAVLFPDVPPAGPPEALVLPRAAATSGLPELDASIDVYCDRDIDIFVYLTPHSLGLCRQPPALRAAALAYLRTRQRTCTARLHLYDFQYPNAVTTEGVASPVRLSLYYRPDGHPRPTVGDLMAAAMFERPFPAGTPAALTDDFGADLMAVADPVAWWQRRLPRCHGLWPDGPS